MQTILEICQLVLPVVTLIGIGQLCKLRGSIGQEVVNGCKTLICNYFLPITLFYSLATVELSMQMLLILLVSLVMNTTAFGLGFLLKKLFRIQNRYFPYLLAGYEVGLLGMALFPLLYGQEGLGYLASLDLGNCFFFFFVLLPSMQASGGGQKLSLGRKLRSVLSVPSVIGCLLGIVLNASGLAGWIFASPLGQTVNSCISMATQASTPLVLIVVGYGLSFNRRIMGMVAKTCLLRVVSMAIVCGVSLLLFRLLGVHEPLAAYASIFMCSLSAPYACSMYADDDSQQEYISTQLSIYVVVTILVFTMLSILT
jgi:predicted permease